MTLEEQEGGRGQDSGGLGADTQPSSPLKGK